MTDVIKTVKVTVNGMEIDLPADSRAVKSIERAIEDKETQLRMKAISHLHIKIKKAILDALTPDDLQNLIKMGFYARFSTRGIDQCETIPENKIRVIQRVRDDS